MSALKPHVMMLLLLAVLVLLVSYPASIMAQDDYDAASAEEDAEGEEGEEYFEEFPSGVLVLRLDEGEMGANNECAQKLEAGDIVSVSHKGFAWDSETEEKGRQIDENPKGEPLIFEMGSGSVIRGMEIAMSGMCLGEKILAVLPPATAFDDPERNFQNKPVGDGEHVAYEIKVEDIHRPSAVEKLFSRAYRVWSQVAPFVAIIILVAIFAFFLRVISKMSSKNAVPAKVKRGKKGKKKGRKSD